MKEVILYILILAAFTTKAQVNLVPNGSFEEYDSIPDGFLRNSEQLGNYINNWLSPTNGTPDYYHLLSNNSENQIPRQTISNGSYLCINSLESIEGSAFCGILFGYTPYNAKQVNEYVGCQLTIQLKLNHKYELQFLGSKNICSELNLSTLGVYLSADPIRQYYPNSWQYPNWSNFETRYKAQYYVPIEKYSSTEWVENEYIFRADGNETWLTIGNFWQEGQYDSLYDPTTDTTIFSYYFIDDVSLIEIPCLVGQDTTCRGEQLTFYSTFAGPFEWWSNDELVSTDSIFNFIAVEGWYHLRTPHGEDSLYLFVLDEFFDITDISDTLCPGEVLEVDLPKQYTYLWENGSSSSSRIFSLPTSEQVLVYSDYCKDSINVTLEYFLVPTGIGYSEFTFCKDSTSSIEVNLFADNLYWSDGVEGSKRSFYHAGNYGYEIIDSNGCSSIGDVVIIERCPSKYYIPNAFVPSGINKIFRPYLGNVLEAELTIYNRWGEKIYTEKSSNPTWNGTYQGTPCSAGVYFYTLEIIGLDNKKEYLKGNVHLLR